MATQWFKRWSWIFCALSISGGCTFHEDKIGGGKDIPTLDKLTLDYGTVRDLVLAPKCLECHAVAGPHKPALLRYEDVLATVISGHPEQSDLFLSLRQNGGNMPKNNPSISENQLLLIEAWIKAGVPLNAGPGDTKPPPPIDPPEVEPPDEVVDPTLTAIREKVFKRYCLDCHTGPDAEGSTDLNNYDDLVNNLLEPNVVVPGQPEKSVLYKDVTSKRMPRRLRNEAQPKVLPESAKKAIYDWILQGAANN